MIEIEKKRLYFKKTFTIAYESVDYVDLVFVKLKNKNGNISYGTASPDPEVTGETIKDVYEVLSNIDETFFDKNFSNVNYYHDKIQKMFSEYPSVQHALEEAIINQNEEYYHGVGKIMQKPIMVTIGINDLQNTIDEVKERIAEGFLIIKLKIGKDVDQDIQMIKAVRGLMPEKIGLALDANHAYNIKKATKLLKAISNENILFIEQPLPKELDFCIPDLQKIISFPIIADESIVGISDVERIISKGFYRGINIKLMKCGGPINFLKIFEMAKKNNFIVMIGCMYESNLSITTGAQLALRLPIDYIDLDSGSIDFDEEMFKNTFVENGHILVKTSFI